MTVYQEIRALVQESSSIVITSHRSPDGDSIGSSMG
ncbi:MAG: bifunctional oligoribonuclease/PAP phosphatase NrnA, partial [Crocinitomicaceae bacterium]|nr:bifunctional oligoribonuclease/PAP phosphatase NrnA [Crocinitomicaceae bacterium]